MTLSTTRIELNKENTKIVFTDYQTLYRDLRDSGLFERVGKRMDNISNEQKKILSSLYTTIRFQGKKVIRVSTAYDFSNTNSILPNYKNLYYYETKISEREPTQEEKSLYEDSFSNCPTPIYEFTIPPLEYFKNPEKHDEFKTTINNPEDMNTISEKIQRKIEYSKWLKIKTSYIGAKSNLEPEWNPNIDSHDSDVIKLKAEEKYFTLLGLWEDMFNLHYQEWLSARLYVLNRNPKKLKGREIVALELIDTNESYCQYCGKIDNKEKLLNIENKIDKMWRVCITCAESRREFNDDEVIKAKETQLN